MGPSQYIIPLWVNALAKIHIIKRVVCSCCVTIGQGPLCFKAIFTNISVLSVVQFLFSFAY
jgi:hypothetical protein